LTLNLGFKSYKIKGSVPASDKYASGLVIPPAPNWVEFPYFIQEGDVVFYHQHHASYFADYPDGLFNHAAIIVGWGMVTKKGEYPYMMPTLSLIPHIADHSSGYSRFGPRAINDTASQVNEIEIVHIPYDIPVKETKLQGCGK